VTAQEIDELGDADRPHSQMHIRDEQRPDASNFAGVSLQANPP
jgi:hypothetical protein